MANLPKLPFLWELSLDGVVSHAVGTIHFSPYNFRQECKELLSGKSTLMVEYDIRTDMDLTRISTPLGQYLDRLPLVDQYFFAETIVGMGLTELKTKPAFWLAQGMSQKAGIPLCADYGVDTAFLTLATEQELTTISLETWNEQEEVALKVLSKFSESLYFMIEKERRKEGTMREFYIKFWNAILSGNGMKVGDYLAESKTFDREGHIQRNRVMVERSLTELARPSLLAVGFTHLIGDHSMLDFYKEQGVAVKRI